MARKRMDRSFLTYRPGAAPAFDRNNLARPEKEEREYGVIQKLSPDGKLCQLTLNCPRTAKSNRGSAQINVSDDWLKAEHLSVPFATAIFSHIRKFGPSTQVNKVQALNRFFAFMCEQGKAHFKLSDLTTTLFNEYIFWLDTQQLTSKTKAGLISPLRVVLHYLKQNPQYTSEVPGDAYIQPNPWPGINEQIAHRPILAITDLVTIERACIKEMQTWMRKWEEGNDFIKSGRERLQAGASPTEHRLETLLAIIEDRYGGYVTNSKQFFADGDGRRRQIEFFGGIKGIAPWLYATKRSLVPFVVMMAIRTAFNPETILALRKSALRESSLLKGSAELAPRYRVVGGKKRARGDQVRTYPQDSTEIDSPISIFNNVGKLTRRLPNAEHDPDHDMLFIFQGRNYGRAHHYLNATCTFPNALSAFRKDNQLPDFSLSNIRPTISEIVNQLSNGDIKAQQAILNHWHTETTETHYVSEAARHRRRETLGNLLNRRERYIRTSGKSDDRINLPNNTGRAATPGFECTDPYDSPLASQSTGQLCTAWGECPLCPRAAVIPDNSHALAQLLHLHNAIEKARHDLPPGRWLYWSTVQKGLDNWLSKFPARSVWHEAKNIQRTHAILIE
ncbi:MAG: hypothetical protein CMO03_09950 [Thalassospira sp.]|jgi:hypothetical protein|uniref:Core-binding (CB) domain-containing protein n=3 Tax=Thalassospiraceae TaxID=2844866 RepID=A0ABR5XYY7_9PROT|nr:hypothetical protein DY252_15380 [Thalassospira indica]KZD01500.1 hypothetical protein AUP40_20115 [Thalassospira xiamenensis]MAB31861.1 hypothetical protein [Thalassospira sp.]OAZ12447.1 hypothetical protein TH15_15875 [Thalassospira profundimaris]OCK10002.1 hypothetical protein KO164_4183 [Thalassospira sp. KO164]OHZ03760.1 hypothetical protein BC440_04970 [Thalassospira sp. MIT1004]OSQ27950.1 hypothetical protein TH468_19525 [Thalassospira sp. MCCC 1A03138]PXX27939.1 hypothetical prote|tara:strand:- start:641 stop:2497 length:1857 start_codon:yes stop_codon:yes gene_type:complete